ncbi:MAG TPA: methyltransferase domain-containing protein [Pseudomonadales bacterium]
MPLTLLQCESCGHAQLREKIAESIYENYIYVTPPSSDLSDYLITLAGDLRERFNLHGKRILEAGSSNGAFLKFFAADNDVLGIEPSITLAQIAHRDYGVQTIQGYLGVVSPPGTYDMIFCRHVLEHINDIEAFTAALTAACRPGSLLLIEVPSFDRTVSQENYSNIFHEHVNYFSRDVLRSLFAKKCFALVHSYDNEIHGGSMGLVFEYKGEPVAVEAGAVTDAGQLYRNFNAYLQNVHLLLRAERFIGYGAAHRTFTLLSMLGLVDRVDYIVDKNPGYAGKFIGGTAIPIRRLDSLDKEKGREIIVFASSYEKQILTENGPALGRNTFICVGSSPRRVQHTNMMASAIRRHVLRMKHGSGSSHSGSALSIADILAVLYFKVLDVDPADPRKPDRDRFLLSKGHASAALYATLAERGFFPVEKLQGFFRNGGVLPGHVDMTAVPGIEASSGSLGHGLSLGLGMALALRRDVPGKRVFVLCGDGEMDEGSVWEAIMYAPRIGLDNLALIVDQNGLQGYAPDGAEQGEPLAARIAAFGWHAIEVDGHDHEALAAALAQKPGRPLAIVAKTVKGKGVSYMENAFIWHYKSPNEQQLAQALKELE